jgi:hypothetical protein
MSRKLNGTTASNIMYTGIVRLSQYTNGKKFTVAEIHNKGGKALFDFLANCLVGDYELAQADRPHKILLLNIDDETKEIKQAANTSPIRPLTTPERVYSADEGIVKYSFIVPQEYFAAGGASGATRFNAIGLYPESAGTVEDYSAYCLVDTSNWSISMSSVLVLDWELHISN